MREIEIKARIKNAQTIINALSDQGCEVGEPVIQHDRVFGIAGVAGAANNGEPWLRIRTEVKNGATRHYFTLKKSITNQLDSIEHETIIEDDAELERIIKHLDFVPYSDLTKTRQKAHIGDIEICIDEVKNLGAFIEAEKLAEEDADYEATINELWAVFEQLGISRDDEVLDGYDVLMNKQLGRE